MRIGIFTKDVHIEKIVNFMNQFVPEIDYIISTTFEEINAFDFDIGISYCFPHWVDVNNPKKPWYNYHPAPLPEYPGVNNYVDAISKKVMSYGVTLHIMTEEIDMGEVLEKRNFAMLSVPVNNNELGNITHYHLFQLFKDTIRILVKAPNNREEFEAMK